MDVKNADGCPLEYLQIAVGVTEYCDGSAADESPVTSFPGFPARRAQGSVCLALLFSLYLAPTITRIELGHCCRCLCCGLPQILLEQHTILVNDECHHSRIAVFRGIGYEGESAGHLAIDDIVLRAALRVTTLPLQHTEVVAIERRARFRLYTVPLIGCKRRQRSERALRLAFWRFPVQTVLLTAVTDEFQRVLFRASIVVSLREVLGLSVGHRSTNVDDCQFVPANSARQNLILPCTSIKEPLPGRVFLQRNREWKIVSTDYQNLRSIGHLAPAVHHSIGFHKSVEGRLVLYGITRENYFFRFRTEDCEHCILIPGHCRVQKSIPSVVRRSKG